MKKNKTKREKIRYSINLNKYWQLDCTLSITTEYYNKKDKNIKIFGIYRSLGNKNLLKNKRIELIKSDLCNFSKTQKIIKKINPDLIFHLASTANVRASFDKPREVIENNIAITLNLLEIIRINIINPLIVICSTSEVYGKVSKKDIPIKETKSINPVNPYSVSKAFQDHISQIYYKIYGLKIIINIISEFPLQALEYWQNK